MTPHHTVRAELVEASAYLSEPFDRLRANGEWFAIKFGNLNI
jgi:hypothetical protein